MGDISSTEVELNAGGEGVDCTGGKGCSKGADGCSTGEEGFNTEGGDHNTGRGVANR